MKNTITRLQSLQQETEKKTGLCVIRIETEKEMGLYLESGLAGLYTEIFAGPPYNEKFTRAEVDDIFQGFLRDKGRVFVALDDNRPVAFVTSVPLKSAFNAAAAAGVSTCNMGYFAEDGVAEKYRRRGISEGMKALLLEANYSDGADGVLLRTSINNYAQINAVGKAGGIVIGGRFQDVERNQVAGGAIVDRNAFYRFSRNGSEVRSLEKVTVIAGEKGDIAYVEDASVSKTPKGWLQRQFTSAERYMWADRIRKAYPRITKVVFDGEKPQGREVFGGRMYVAEPFASAGPR